MFNKNYSTTQIDSFEREFKTQKTAGWLSRQYGCHLADSCAVRRGETERAALRGTLMPLSCRMEK